MKVIAEMIGVCRLFDCHSIGHCDSNNPDADAVLLELHNDDRMVSFQNFTSLFFQSSLY